MLKVDIKEKIYKMKKSNFKALDKIDFEINENGIVCILGQSGSGKTTLMNIMGAIDSDFSGDILISGNSLKNFKNKDLDRYRNENIGFVFQQFYLINKLSAYDNIKVALELSNDKNINKNKRIYELLEKVDMTKFAKTKVNLLSGGQKQRIAIARALANNPNVILADEPTGALDEKTSENIMQFLKDLSKDKSIVIITHNKELATKYADRIISIKDGKIEEDYKNINQNYEINSTVLEKEELKQKNIEDIEQKETKNIVDNNNNNNNKTKSMSILSTVAYSLKNMLSRKRRTILAAIGMSIGIVGIGIAFALSNGTMNFAKVQVESVTSPNMVQISKKGSSNDVISVKYGSSESDHLKYTEFYKIKDKNSRIKYFWSIPANVMEKFFVEVSAIEENVKTPAHEENSFFLQQAMTPFEKVENHISYGAKPKGKYEIAISLNTAQNLIKDTKTTIEELIGRNVYIRFDDTSLMMSNEISESSKILTFEIVGITSINTLNNTFYQYSDDTISLYEELYNIKKEDMKFQEQYLFLDDTLKSEEIKKEVEKLNSEYPELQFAIASESIISGVEAVLNTVRNVLIGFSSISVVVAILMIGIVVYISVIERTKEIGILRAIGASKKDIRNIFISESSIIGFLAGAIGVLITILTTVVIKEVVKGVLKTQGMDIGNISIAELEPTIGIILILVCVVLAIIAGIIPANKAAKLDPVVALRRG